MWENLVCKLLHIFHSHIMVPAWKLAFVVWPLGRTISGYIPVRPWTEYDHQSTCDKRLTSQWACKLSLLSGSFSQFFYPNKNPKLPSSINPFGRINAPLLIDLFNHCHCLLSSSFTLPYPSLVFLSSSSPLVFFISWYVLVWCMLDISRNVFLIPSQMWKLLLEIKYNDKCHPKIKKNLAGKFFQKTSFLC